VSRVSDAPTWYDLLDLPRDASTEEIRAAWKGHIADLEPGDRRFDALNRAAKVLLDPASRAAYDAGLGDETADEPDEPVAPVVEEDAPAPVTTPDTDREPRTVPTWLLVGLGIVAAVLLAVTAWAWTREDGGADEAARAAQTAAEAAVVPVLSYDYEHLEEDRKAAKAEMTGKYGAEYDKFFALIEQNAPETQTKVGAEVVSSGIVRATEDRVQVLVFVDRPTTNKLSAEPTVYKDQATLSMQLVDGVWLVDDMVTSPVQG